jgi:DNA-binding MarR family transcriptional regulator
MNHDFLDELAELALGSRLKRLSERMMSDAAKVYQHYDLQVQPKWFTLLALLAQKGPTSVVQASEFLGLTQPAISQFSLQLVKHDFIVVKLAPDDMRKKYMQLTTKGQEQVNKMRPMWDAVNFAAKELCSEADNDFYSALLTFEQALAKRSLYQRTLDQINEQ